MNRMLNYSRKAIFSIFTIVLLGSISLASAALFVDSFDVSNETTFPAGQAFNTDGTKMFVLANEAVDKEVNEYACTTGFDISTCSFTVKAGNPFDVSPEDTSPTDIAFNTDGTKLFVVGNIGDVISEYACTTGFDISTCSFTVKAGNPLDVTAQEGQPGMIAFNTDGTKMFIMGVSGDDVNEYACGVGFDISSCDYSGDGERFSIATEEGTPTDLAFNTDGTKLFVVGLDGDDVNEYACTTGFDVSTCEYSGDDERFSVFTEVTNVRNIAFSANGLKMFVTGVDGDAVNEYTLGAVFDVSSIPSPNGSSNPFSGGFFTAPTIGLDRYGMRIIEDGFSYNGNAVDVVDFHTPFPLISAQTGQTNTLAVKISDNSSSTGIRLVQFGLGIPELDSPINSAEVIIEVWFEYGGDNIEEVKIIDKNNLIDNSSVKISTKAVDCRAGATDQCTEVSMKHKYREAPIYNIIRVEIMDGQRNVQTSTFNDGVEVLGESMNPADTMNIIPVTLQNYPQKRGMIELTNIDRSEKLWTDPYGYVWQGDESRMVLVSTIPIAQPDINSKSIWSGYNDRINSNFAMYKETQSDLALGMMEAYYRTSINYEEPFSELNDIFSYEYPTPGDRTNDVLMQQEISKANTILEQLCPKCSDQSFVD